MSQTYHREETTMGLPGKGKRVRVVRDPAPAKEPITVPAPEPVKEPVPA